MNTDMRSNDSLACGEDDTQPDTPRDIAERPTLRSFRIPPRSEEDSSPATLRSVRSAT